MNLNLKSNTIGVLILTKNEEKHMAACLQCCSFFDEIVVLDSFSSDNTVAIAQQYQAKIYRRKFTNFKDQREFGIEKMESRWVFMLDADERIPDELREAILAFTNQQDFTLLLVPRRNHLFGQPVDNSGWYPDYQSRLARRDTIFFEDKIVHEKMQSTGKTECLAPNTGADLIHFTYDSIAHFLRKVNHYSTLEAEQHFQNSRYKTTVWAILHRMMRRLSKTLFHYKAYRDGMRGFIIAGINTIHVFLVMVKIWELRQTEHGNDGITDDNSLMQRELT